MSFPATHAEAPEFQRRDALATENERAGHVEAAWKIWEELRAEYPDRRDWNGPLVASYLGYAMGWTADQGRGDAQDALAALVRVLAILAGELSDDGDDVTRWILVARALEQRCILTAFGRNWTSEARSAMACEDEDALPALTGDKRLVRSTALAAEAALDMLAVRPELARSARASLEAARRRVGLVRRLLELDRHRRPVLKVLMGGAGGIYPVAGARRLAS